MSRRTAGASASAQARVAEGRPGAGRSAGRGPVGERATDGRTARRLAATLGPPAGPGLPCDEEKDAAPGGGPSGLLETGTGGGFAYGREAGSARSAVSGEVAEPRFRWRLGIRAAVLVGVLSLLAGALLWWQVAANGPVVLPLTSVTQDAAGKSSGQYTRPGQQRPGEQGPGRQRPGPWQHRWQWARQ
jgi:competence protein ComEA